eukprot:TCALIF_13605-PA protein Name:"Similar to pol Pol polyprotein (Caprine arthritis encephalitis virus (strain Cork))" AED:0.30 eAED:0.30 QI:0/0/0/0.5/1/1/2/0/395
MFTSPNSTRTPRTGEIRFLMDSLNDRCPERPYTRGAGVDIFVPGNHHPRSEVITLPPGIPTRITIAIRIRVVPGLYLQLATQSSQAAQGITVLGGIIDPDYTGHLHVYLINLTHQVQHWPKNRAIAQLLVHCQVFSDMLPSGPATMTENATPAAGDRGTRCEVDEFTFYLDHNQRRFPHSAGPGLVDIFANDANTEGFIFLPPHTDVYIPTALNVVVPRNGAIRFKAPPKLEVHWITTIGTLGEPTTGGRRPVVIQLRNEGDYMEIALKHEPIARLRLETFPVTAFLVDEPGRTLDPDEGRRTDSESSDTSEASPEPFYHLEDLWTDDMFPINPAPLPDLPYPGPSDAEINEIRAELERIVSTNCVPIPNSISAPWLEEDPNFSTPDWPEAEIIP